MTVKRRLLSVSLKGCMSKMLHEKRKICRKDYNGYNITQIELKKIKNKGMMD